MSPGPAQQAEAAAFFGHALPHPTTYPLDRSARPAAESDGAAASTLPADRAQTASTVSGAIAEADAGRALEFDALVAQYEKKIFNVIYRFLGDYEEATDLTQETFLSAYRHYDRFRGEAKVFTWLYQIARNLCINRIRQRDRQRALRVESLDQPCEPGPHGNPTREIADWSAAPQQVLEGKELRQRILAAIEALPPEYKEVVLLREFHDLSYSEIVTATGLTLENVKTRLSRARAMLRRKLEPYYRLSASNGS
ncbi:MAG TPA: sigma-70 family RNA polymerase sigma factor [Chthonomonadaceae bacterium]|nr:sigma-70 family RNA polymerase sigma factor [Chthonomonadaceae bacterium]